MTPSPCVLIVDDDFELLELLSFACKQIGIQTHAVENSNEAKDWLKSNVPSLAIIDVMMPGGNGLDLCRWIRHHDRFESLPIILSSALKDEETMQDALALGAVDFVRKPYKVEALQEKITRYIRRA